MTSPSPSDQDRAACDCGHLEAVHSREPGIGCLHFYDAEIPLPAWRTYCPCLRAGSSGADQ